MPRRSGPCSAVDRVFRRGSVHRSNVPAAGAAETRVRTAIRGAAEPGARSFGSANYTDARRALKHAIAPPVPRVLKTHVEIAACGGAVNHWGRRSRSAPVGSQARHARRARATRIDEVLGMMHVLVSESSSFCSRVPSSRKRRTGEPLSPVNKPGDPLVKACGRAENSALVGAGTAEDAVDRERVPSRARSGRGLEGVEKERSAAAGGSSEGGSGAWTTRTGPDRTRVVNSRCRFPAGQRARERRRGEQRQRTRPHTGSEREPPEVRQVATRGDE